MSSNGNDSDPACKYYVNDYDKDNFKKELIKVLKEGLKEISGRLFFIESTIEKLV